MRLPVTFFLVSLAGQSAIAAAGAVVDLASGPGAWVAWGAAGDGLGYVAKVADVNGDGVPDPVLFAQTARPGPAGTRLDAGKGYVFFGPTSGWTKRQFDLRVDAPDVLIYGAVGQTPGAQPGDTLGFYGGALAADVVGD